MRETWGHSGATRPTETGDGGPVPTRISLRAKENSAMPRAFRETCPTPPPPRARRPGRCACSTRTGSGAGVRLLGIDHRRERDLRAGVGTAARVPAYESAAWATPDSAQRRMVERNPGRAPRRRRGSRDSQTRLIDVGRLDGRRVVWYVSAALGAREVELTLAPAERAFAPTPWGCSQKKVATASMTV
jgi:hypothetical protein